MQMEIALMIAHLLVLTMRDKVELVIPCKLASVGLQYFFISSFAFLLLESIQAYAIATNVIASKGYFSRIQSFILGWGGSGLITALSATMKHKEYTSYWSCWTNLGSSVVYATFVPIGCLASVSIIVAEASGMGHYTKLPATNIDQLTAALTNAKGLVIIIPASVASWFTGLFAVYYANLAMYGLVSALNMTLGICVFMFHTLGNPELETLQENKADLTIPFMTLKYERAKLNPHLGPLLKASPVFVFKANPRYLPNLLDIPFPVKGLVLLISLMLVVKLINLVLKKLGLHWTEKHLVRTSVIFGIFLQLFWNYFFGNIVLLFNKPPALKTPFSNVREVVEKLKTREFTLISASKTLKSLLIQTSIDRGWIGNPTEIGVTKMMQTEYQTVEFLMNSQQSQKYIVIMASVFLHHMENRFCDLSTLIDRNEVTRLPIAYHTIYYRRNLSLPKIDAAKLRFLRFALKHWRKKLRPKKACNLRADMISDRPSLSVNQMVGFFFLILTCFGVAFGTLIAETLSKCQCHSWKQRPKESTVNNLNFQEFITKMNLQRAEILTIIERFDLDNHSSGLLDSLMEKFDSVVLSISSKM